MVTVLVTGFVYGFVLFAINFLCYLHVWLVLVIFDKAGEVVRS